MFGGDSDAGVTNGEMQRHAVLGLLLLHRDGQHNLAFGGELHRVAQDVQDHLAQASSIAHDGLGHISGDVESQLQALLSGAQCQHLRGVAHGFAQLELGVFQIQVPRLNLREVEDVVDELQQRFARRSHDAEVILLFGGQTCFQRQRGHPENGVERRANLVAHVGEKRALGHGGVLGSPLRRFELLDHLRELVMRLLEIVGVAGHRLLGGLALGNVPGGRIHHLLLRVRRRSPQEPPRRPVFVEVAVLVVNDSCPFLRLLRLGKRPFAIVGMHEVQVRS